jgi:hypothetical protein
VMEQIKKVGQALGRDLTTATPAHHSAKNGALQ